LPLKETTEVGGVGDERRPAVDAEPGERRTHFIGQIRRLLGSYSALGLPIRLALSGVVGAISGSGLLGFLSEYATYSYAIRYGLRVPVEGAPYLGSAVSAISLSMALTAVIFFLVLYFVAKFSVVLSERAFSGAKYLQVMYLFLRSITLKDLLRSISSKDYVWVALAHDTTELLERFRRRSFFRFFLVFACVAGSERRWRSLARSVVWWSDPRLAWSP
jgi:hypothetical protein